MSMPSTHELRLNAARMAIEGLSVGDAVGRHLRVDHSAVETSTWRYSDDTEMALAILEVLTAHRCIEQDPLATAFARRFHRDPERGYGAVAYWLLYQLTMGKDWRTVSAEVFRGQGSMGNGAAMRAAPIGAYFAEDIPTVVTQARLAAQVTHAHADGQAGAVAVAVAAACAYTHRLSGTNPEDRARHLFEEVLRHTPEGATRTGLGRAALLIGADVAEAANALGDGTAVCSYDTVPLSLWCAAHHLDDYEGALRTSLSACHQPSADRDTVCAIVGSIVVMSAGLESIPPAWHAAREPLD
jgi:ADP-ribosylglycohydrolase